MWRVRDIADKMYVFFLKYLDEKFIYFRFYFAYQYTVEYFRTNVVMNYTEIEAKVRTATNDDAWGPTGTICFTATVSNELIILTIETFFVKT